MSSEAVMRKSTGSQMTVFRMTVMQKLCARVRGLAVVAACAAASACAPVQTTSSGAVGVQRTQYISSLVSPAQVEQAAAQMYAQTLQEARQAGQLNRDAAAVARVRGIAQRLIAQVGAFRPDAAN